MFTPRKFPDKTCVVCKVNKSSGQIRKINSEAGKKKRLADLLLKYGSLNVVEGCICRACENRLFTLHDKCEDFRSQCQRPLTQISVKRCASLNDNEQQDKVATRVKLFSSDCGPENDHTGVSGSFQDSELFSSFLDGTDSELSSFFNRSIPTLTPIRPKSGEYQQPLSSTPVRQAQQQDHIYARTVTDSQSSVNEKERETCDHTYIKNATHIKSRKTKSKGKAITCDEPSSKLSPFSKSLLDFVHETIHITAENDQLNQTEIKKLVSSLTVSKTEFFKCVNSIPSLKGIFQSFLLKELSASFSKLKNRKHGYISELRKKSYEDLRDVSWEGIVAEAMDIFPLFVQVCLAMLLPLHEEMGPRQRELVQGCVPKLGILYGILGQHRDKELSRIQRLNSMLLFDNICDQKVFDRFNPLGICLSHERSLEILDHLGGTFNRELIDTIKEKRVIRIIGDNINWMTRVHDQRKDNRDHMNHAFGSAVIVQTLAFNDLPSVIPQRCYMNAPLSLFLPSEADYNMLRSDYVILISRIASRLVLGLSFMGDVFPKHIEGTHSRQLNKINSVIPLPVLHCNEQCYDDVVKIMDHYETVLQDVHEAAGTPMTSVHVGGDQLTRERFSGAKRLRAGALTLKERFHHLRPITFELFHLLMNYMKLVFKNLYTPGSETDIGTIANEANRILRTNINENVNEHYDADKDFFISFVDCYVVEALLDYFGMDDINSTPTNHAPPPSWTNLEKETYVRHHLTQVVNSYVFNRPNEDAVTGKTTSNEKVIVDGTVINIRLKNGEMKSVIVKKVPVKKSNTNVKVEDCVKNYGHVVLELGLLFKNLIDLTKVPDRDRGLCLLKFAMVHFKANNQLSKYAYEIMRFLVQQYCVLSEQEAHRSFYGLFVNTRGKIDSHIPADLQMEYLVKKAKKHIHHMFSNKTEKNISSRTSVFAALGNIASAFDDRTSVRIRSKKHSDRNSDGDEMDIIKDLRRLRPFKFIPGRSHEAFPMIKASIQSKLDTTQFHSWIAGQRYKFATEIGT